MNNSYRRPGVPPARDPYRIKMGDMQSLRNEIRQSLQHHMQAPDISLDVAGRSSSTSTELVDRRNGEYLVQPGPVGKKWTLHEIHRGHELQEGGWCHLCSSPCFFFVFVVVLFCTVFICGHGLNVKEPTMDLMLYTDRDRVRIPRRRTLQRTIQC